MTPEQPPAGHTREHVRLRPALEGLPAYVAGKRAEGPRVFKLSSNEVAHPPLPAVVAAIADAAVDVNRYGQMAAEDLSADLAERLRVDADAVLAGNGSVALIELVVRSAAADGDEVVYPWRSFEAYPILVQASGATGVPVPNRPDGGHDLEAMLAAITPATRVVMVCTPNNPTGAALTHTELAAFLPRVPKDVLVLLDEAYVHFDRTADRLDGRALLAEHANLVLARTFSKAYGLAGLRVGYLVGRPRIVRTLRAAATPFAVNAVAQRAARVALAQQPAIDEIVDEVVRERERVVAALRGQGWDLGHPQGNFYWLRLGERATAFASAALDAGITVRPFDGDGVRVSIGEPEANDLAIALAARWR
ncbi:histidinol-phosphate transaminase [Pseudactinotalea sp. HY158]|uniref:histidinol-phosphate transaminase n=1 Tax=Pseudactinotalea sp. HY158 TaxID=2654547 RepID=UPI00129CC4A8|nr:histidinol-phosphate transaminase [Pseudactinotalea sp. HY158]QGH70754.1 aminotransferase class I/II-fold pyridoxal phosphate-dependent enzyme [Pseudactinotalea sp. HY158]